MDYKELCSAIGGIIFAFAFVPYIMAIWKTRHLAPGTPGKAEPRKSSWILWWTIDMILLVSMALERQFNWQLTAACVLALVVVALSIKYGTPGWNLLDKICMAATVLAIIGGFVLKEPLVSISIGLLALFTAAVPTFVSAWEDPRRENKTTWVLFVVSCAFTLLSVTSWTLEGAGQPVMFAIIDLIALAIILFKRQLAAIGEGFVDVWRD